MTQDYTHCEQKRFNKLLIDLDIEFKEEHKNTITGNQYEMGTIQVTDNNEIFKQSKKLYLKEISTLNIKSPARSILNHNGDVVIAATKYGKGTVFAVGDPWLYRSEER